MNQRQATKEEEGSKETGKSHQKEETGRAGTSEGNRAAFCRLHFQFGHFFQLPVEYFH